MNTLVFNDSVVRKIENSIKDRNDVEIYFFLGKVMMVNEENKNPLLELSKKYSEKILINSLDERPYIHCTLIMPNEKYNFASWRTPHFEHECIRSNVAMDTRKASEIILEKYDLNNYEKIKNLSKIEKGLLGRSDIIFKKESEFNFDSWFTDYILKDAKAGDSVYANNQS